MGESIIKKGGLMAAVYTIRIKVKGKGGIVDPTLSMVLKGISYVKKIKMR